MDSRFRSSFSPLTPLISIGLVSAVELSEDYSKVLVKAKKLYEHERTLILQRFQLIRRGYKIEGLEKKVRYLADAFAEVAEKHGLTVEK